MRTVNKPKKKKNIIQKGTFTFAEDAVNGGDTGGISASGSTVTSISGTWIFGWRMRRDVEGDGFGSGCCVC